MDKLFKKFEKKGAEFIDVRILNHKLELISIEDFLIKSIQSLNSFQVGVRVFYNGGWGFAYTNNEKKIGNAMNKAFKLAKISSNKSKFICKIPVNKKRIKFKGKSSFDVPIEEKIKVAIDICKKATLKEIKNRTVELAFSLISQNYLNSIGTDVFEEKEYFNLRISLTGKKRNKLRQSFERVGMVGDYNLFLKIDINKLVLELENKLKEYFYARGAPAGKYPIVIDNVLAQVFFHEAVGHATEADSIIEKSSVFVGKLGKKIAPEFLNLYDNPKIKNEHGFYNFDDEGICSKNTQLIKNGILVNYLHSIETANKLNMEPTGNGRAEDAFNIPIPRMSNIVLDKGDFEFDELFEGIKYGVYAKNSLGGIVEPTTGNFLFNAKDAYLIENGKITKPILGVSFGGNILETLMKIERIGNDQKPSFGGWRCGKKDQIVPVGGSAPHIMISEAIIGGNK